MLSKFGRWALALGLLAPAGAQEPATAKEWLNRAHVQETLRDWKGVKQSLDRAVELEKKDGVADLAHYERALLPFRFMVHAMPFVNDSVAGVLTSRTDVWSFNVNLALTVRHQWLIVDPIGFNDPNDPLILEAALDLSELRKNPARAKEALAGEAVIAYLQRRDAKADYLIRKALAELPGEPDLLMAAGLESIRLREYEAALDYVDRSIEARPEAPLPYAVRAGLRVAVKGDVARALEDLHRFAKWVEPWWGRALEHGCELVRLGRAGEWTSADFKKAVTGLIDALRPTSGMTAMMFGPLFDTLKDEAVQDRAIAFGLAIEKTLASGAEGDAEAESALSELAKAIADSPLKRSLFRGLVPQSPESQEKLIRAAVIVGRLWHDGTVEQKIERWEGFRAWAEKDWPTMFGPPAKKSAADTMLALADAAVLLTDAAEAFLYAQAGDDAHRREKLELLLTHLADADRAARISRLFGLAPKKGPAVHDFLAVFRAQTLLQLGRRDEAVGEIRKMLPKIEGWGAFLDAGWTFFEQVRKGAWDKPEFREALNGILDAYLVTGWSQVIVRALKDPVVQDKVVALLGALSKPAPAEADMKKALNEFFDALTASEWGADRFVEGLEDPVVQAEGLPILVTALAALREREPAKAAERWEQFKKAFADHWPALRDRGEKLQLMSRNWSRKVNQIPTFVEFVPALVDWVQAGLYKQAGDEAKRKAKLESILKFLSDPDVRKRVAQGPGLPDELYTAFEVFVHRELGNLKPAREALGKFVAALEKPEIVKVTRESWNDPRTQSLLRPYLRPLQGLLPLICDAFEDLDPELGARFVHALEAYGMKLHRDRLLFVKRVRRRVEEKELDGAMALVEEWLVADPDDVDALTAKIDVLAAKGETKEALDLCIDVEKRDPWAVAAVRRHVELLKADEKAIDVLGALIDRDRFNAWARFERASRLAALGRGAEALMDAERALELDPGAPAVLALAASIKVDSTDLITKAIEAEPKAAWLYVARGRLRSGEEARSDFDRAVDLNARSVEAVLCRAALHAAAGRLDEAIADYERAIDLHEPRAEAHLGLADALRRSKKLNAALREAHRAVALGAEALTVRARVLADLGDKAGAIRDLESHLKAHPADAEARKLLDDLKK